MTNNKHQLKFHFEFCLVKNNLFQIQFNQLINTMSSLGHVAFHIVGYTEKGRLRSVKTTYLGQVLIDMAILIESPM